MKLYIVGSVASGKTTLAKRLSKITGIHYTALDEIVHKPDMSSKWGNKKRTIEERDEMFSQILHQENWIIEDTGRLCFSEGLKQADKIVFLEISPIIRNRRIVLRWIKQRMGIEKCLYKPSYAMLKCMFGWSKDYDNGKDGLHERIKPYQNKTIVLCNNNDVNKYISEIRARP